MQVIPTENKAEATAKVHGLYLPNAHNCIQAAIHQLGQGNTALAISFLKTAQGSLQKAQG